MSDFCNSDSEFEGKASARVSDDGCAVAMGFVVFAVSVISRRTVVYAKRSKAIEFRSLQYSSQVFQYAFRYSII